MEAASERCSLLGGPRDGHVVTAEYAKAAVAAAAAAPGEVCGTCGKERHEAALLTSHHYSVNGDDLAGADLEGSYYGGGGGGGEASRQRRCPRCGALQHDVVGTTRDEFGGSLSVAGAAATLAATNLGAGVLSLPVSFRYTGWALGLVLLGVVAVLCDAGLVMLVRCARQTGHASLQQIGFAYYGTAGRRAVEVILVVLLFFAQIIHCIIFSGHVHHSLVEWGAPATAWYANEAFIGGCVLALLYPLVLLRDLSGLKFTSAVSVCAMCFFLIAFVVQYGRRDGDGDGDGVATGLGPGPDVVAATTRPFDLNVDSLLALSILAVAFVCQFNVVTVFAELRDKRSRDRMEWVIHGTVGSALFIYVLVGLIGYHWFGAATLGDVLDQPQLDGDRVMDVARLAIALVMIFKFPLIALPFRDAVNEVILAGKTPSRLFLAVEMGITLSVVLGISYAMKSLSKAFTLLGCTTGIAIAFMLPAAFFLRAIQRGVVSGRWNRTAAKALSIAMLSFGAVSVPSSLVMIIYTWNRKDVN